MGEKTIWCVHYRAMYGNETCKAGVEYAQFKGLKFEERPCFGRQGSPPCPGCALQQFPTAAEIAAEEAEMNAMFEQMWKARAAIVTSLGGKWKRGMPGSGGTITCPVCNGHNALRFTRSGYNGHIHAACSTEGCVSWME